MPLVSVIVPNYNHSKYLRQRIDSIINQTFQDFEIILLDDCSTDNSREIIEEYRSFEKVTKIIYNETNGGTSYKQWIKGIDNATGDLIWIAESDDWCENNFLENLVYHFKDPEVTIAISSVKFVFNNNDNYEFDYLYDASITDGTQFIRQKMLGNSGIPNASMLVFRKSKYLQINDLSWNKYKMTGDWLLWIHILYGSKVVTLNQILCYFRQHDTNSTSRTRRDGYDFLEGLDIFNYGRKLCDNQYNKKQVYSDWSKSFINYSGRFETGVLNKVMTKFFETDILLSLSVIFNFFLYKTKRNLQKIGIIKRK